MAKRKVFSSFAALFVGLIFTTLGLWFTNNLPFEKNVSRYCQESNSAYSTQEIRYKNVVTLPQYLGNYNCKGYDIVTYIPLDLIVIAAVGTVISYLVSRKKISKYGEA